MRRAEPTLRTRPFRVPDEGPELTVVVPVHNERENVAAVAERTLRAVDSLGLRVDILFVDDGSIDETPRLLEELADRHSCIGVLTLSRNFGHQAAVSAGIEHAGGCAVVVMDGDLQDPPELIPAMVGAWRDGAEVVYAVRRSRAGSPLLRLAYWSFYRLLRLVCDLPIPIDSGDFGLLGPRAVAALRALPERLRFLRGLRAFVGFRQVAIGFDRPRRAAGEPKYRLTSLVRLAVDGLVSFSGYPLRLVSYLGVAVALVALGLTVWVLRDALVHQTAPRGWASLLVVMLFLGALQMIGLGIVGEYVRGIFLEAKGRPAYIVQDHRPGRAAATGRPPRRPKRLRLQAAHAVHPRKAPLRSIRRPAL